MVPKVQRAPVSIIYTGNTDLGNNISIFYRSNFNREYSNRSCWIYLSQAPGLRALARKAAVFTVILIQVLLLLNCLVQRYLMLLRSIFRDAVVVPI